MRPHTQPTTAETCIALLDDVIGRLTELLYEVRSADLADKAKPLAHYTAMSEEARR